MYSRTSIVHKFSNAAKNNRPLLLDGAIGSLLQQKGFNTDENIWATNINETHPELIIMLHKEYIDSGAEIITTNTFRTNPAALTKAGISNFKKHVKLAVDLAKGAVNDGQIIIAGSNSPAEDCYQKVRKLKQKELELNHYNHIDLLIENGVDLILNETQSHFDEIEIICEYCSNNEIAFIVSIYSPNFQKILSGEDLIIVLKYIWDHGAIAAGINCAPLLNLINIIKEKDKELNWGFYLNCGSGKPNDKFIKPGVSAEQYSDYVQGYLILKPSFVGSCCGSTPAHTKALRKIIDENGAI